MIVILGLIALVTLGSALLLVRALRHAPLGHEDETGCHLAEPDNRISPNTASVTPSTASENKGTPTPRYRGKSFRTGPAAA